VSAYSEKRLKKIDWNYSCQYWCLDSQNFWTKFGV
jgi:hypothetical protein